MTPTSAGSVRLPATWLTSVPVGGAICLLIFAAVLFAAAWIWQVKVVNTGWTPGAKHAEYIEQVKAEEKAAKAAARAAKKAAAEA